MCYCLSRCPCKTISRYATKVNEWSRRRITIDAHQGLPPELLPKSTLSFRSREALAPVLRNETVLLLMAGIDNIICLKISKHDLFCGKWEVTALWHLLPSLSLYTKTMATTTLQQRQPQGQIQIQIQEQQQRIQRRSILVGIFNALKPSQRVERSRTILVFGLSNPKPNDTRSFYLSQIIE